MTKPLAYSNEILTDIEQRLRKGWVVRRDEYETLIAMARERNALAVSPPAAPVVNPIYGM